MTWRPGRPGERDDRALAGSAVAAVLILLAAGCDGGEPRVAPTPPASSASASTPAATRSASPSRTPSPSPSASASATPSRTRSPRPAVTTSKPVPATSRPAPPRPRPGDADLPTHGSDVAPRSAVVAEIVTDGRSCVWLVEPDGNRMAALWPRGFRVGYAPLRIYDERDRLVWRAGEPRRIGGGLSPVHVDRLPPKCRIGRDAWWVAPGSL